MKRILSLLIVAVMLLSLCACGGNSNSTTETETDKQTGIEIGTEDETSTENSTEDEISAEDGVAEEIPTESSVEEEKEPVPVKETKNLILENIVVDDSYRDRDNSPRRAVYVFFTLTPGDLNMEFDSKYMDITINDGNKYTSEVLPSSFCKFAPNYSYSGYIETAYVGESKKLVVTFLIPEGDLVPGKKITFKDSQLKEISEIVVFTDDIIHVNGDAEACKIADPEGYEEVQKKYEEASPELTSQVQSLINGYMWKAYVNSTWYQVEFSYPNYFKVKTGFGENGGTYSVRNGYVFCTYDSNGVTIEIPYEITEQGVSMDVVEAFSLN